MTLKQVLHHQASQWQELGGSPSQAITAIRIYRKSIVRRLFIKVLLFWALLAIGVYVSITLFANQAALPAVVATIFGVVTSLITNLFGTWRELDYSNLVLMLIRDASDDQIRSIVDQLLSKL